MNFSTFIFILKIIKKLIFCIFWFFGIFFFEKNKKAEFYTQHLVDHARGKKLVLLVATEIVRSARSRECAADCLPVLLIKRKGWYSRSTLFPSFLYYICVSTRSH